MLLRSQTLPFLLFENSAAFYHRSFSLLRLMLTLWLCSFLDFQSKTCYLVKDCICCRHSASASSPVGAGRVEWMFFSLQLPWLKWVSADALRWSGELIQTVPARVYPPESVRLRRNISIRVVLWRTVADYSLCCPRTVHATVLNSLRDRHWAHFLIKWPWTGCCLYKCTKTGGRGIVAVFLASLLSISASDLVLCIATLH